MTMEEYPILKRIEELKREQSMGVAFDVSYDIDQKRESLKREIKVLKKSVTTT